MPGSELQVLAVKNWAPHFPAIHTGLLIVTLDLKRNAIQVDKGHDQLRKRVRWVLSSTICKGIFDPTT